MKIQVICRGLTREGMGHLSRTRTFAASVHQDNEVEIVAMVAPGLESFFAGADFTVHLVKREDDVLRHVRAFSPEVLLFDLLSMSRQICSDLVANVPLSGSLSPIFDQMDLLDMVFSRASLPAEAPKTRVFAGLEYAIFGQHCSLIDDATYKSVVERPEMSIGVSMGGVDAANKTLHVLRALATVKADCLIWVLLGEGYAHSYNTLVETVSRDSRHEIVLAKTNRTMWHVMSQCAVAVLAGGLTTIEAVYAGLPSINLSEKPEHSALMQELFALGVCMDGGPFERPALDAMVKEVTLLSSNRNKLWEIRNQTKGLLDLNGPSRVMEEIRREFAARKTTT